MNLYVDGLKNPRNPYDSDLKCLREACLDFMKRLEALEARIEEKEKKSKK